MTWVVAVKVAFDGSAMASVLVSPTVVSHKRTNLSSYQGL